MTDSTIFTTRLCNNLFIEKIYMYSLLDSAILVHALNRLENSSQCLIRTGFSFEN